MVSTYPPVRFVEDGTLPPEHDWVAVKVDGQARVYVKQEKASEVLTEALAALRHLSN